MPHTGSLELPLHHPLNTQGLPAIFGITTITLEATLQEAIHESIEKANRVRKGEATKRLDYYNGNHLEHVKRIVAEQFVESDKMLLQPVWRNIFRAIIQKIALIYKEPPKRTIVKKDTSGELVDSEEDQKLWDEIEKKSNLNAIMKTVNRLTTGLNRMVLKVGFKDEMIKFDMITPNILDIIVEDSDPLTPVAMFWAADSIHRLAVIDSEQGTVAFHTRSEEIKFEYWSTDTEGLIHPGENFIFNGKGEILKNEDNPGNKNLVMIDGKPIIPVVEFGVDMPIDDYFFMGYGDDLVNAQEILNVRLTNLQYISKIQGFSIPVAVGMKADEDVTIDPSVAMMIPGTRPDEIQKDFKFVTPDSKMQDHEQHINNGVLAIANDYNISPENFNNTGAIASGVALKIINMPLLNYRQDQIELYRVADRRLYEIVRAVWNTFTTGKKFSEDSEMMLDYAEVKFPEDRKTELEALALGIELGVTNSADFLKMKNPDLTEDQAEEQVAENLGKKKEVTEPAQANLAAIQPEQLNLIPTEAEIAQDDLIEEPPAPEEEGA